MARYLVTGAAGFIGSNVCRLLLDQEHSVVGVDNLNDAYDVRLKEWRLEQIQKRQNFAFRHIDICNKEEVEAVFSSATGFAAVVNLAARAGVRPSVLDPWSYFETNLTGTLNLLDACCRHAVRKFVLASTSSVYGNSPSQPFSDATPTDRPLSPYAASKKAAEVLCHTYHYLHGLDVTVLRYFTVYGPAGRPDMSLFRFTQWICEGRTVKVFGDGQQSRDFTYVDDVARGTILALRPVGFDVFNLGSDAPILLIDAISGIESLTAKKADLCFEPRHPADVNATWADISRAKQVLGWSPQCPFEEGLRRLVDWYRENRTWAREIET